MDPYIFTLVLGAAGLGAMAVAGAAHLGGDAGSHAGGHTDGHLGTHAGSHTGSHAAGLPNVGHAAPSDSGLHAAPPVIHAGADTGAGASWLHDALVGFASPRAVFTVLLGFGLTGILGRGFLGGALLAGVALAGGVLLEAGVVRPLWNFLFRFASAPAQTLESALLGAATAATSFNRDGEGLVAVEVDGQIIQCLGRLGTDDRALGVRVRAGDRLRVDDVDARRQRCTVSYVGRSPENG